MFSNLHAMFKAQNIFL